MGYLRRLAEKCRNLGEEHVDEPDAPTVANGDGGHGDRVKIGLLLLKEEIDKPLRKLEDYLNEMPNILDVFGLTKSPNFTSFSMGQGIPYANVAKPTPPFSGAGWALWD